MLSETLMAHVTPTRYPDVNRIINLLLSRVRGILGDQLIGMVLHGSLANGGFDEYSDIDVIFVTRAELSEDEFFALHEMHADMAKMDSPWAVQQEVSYIPQRALRRFDRSDMLYPHLDRGQGETLRRMAYESDWIIQRHILRERGIVIMGPDLKSLIDPVKPDDLRRAVAEGLPLWLHPILAEPAEIRKRGYQSFFVLSMCRMLYTLKHGEILSKQDAAAWAMQNLDPYWMPLIERALRGRQSPDMDAQPEDIEGTLQMMRFILDQIQPTPYPDVNEILALLSSNVQKILGDQFIGLYLYGSLSSGDFNSETSDIDFLVVTKQTLSREKIANLEDMHQQTWASSLKRAGQLEGAYVPKDLIRRHDPRGHACPTVNEGRFYVAALGSDWILQRHVVREMGVVVEGPDPKTLIDPVGPDDIRGAVMGILEEWWFPMLADPAWLCDHGSKYQAFAVISMCRVLHALAHGTVVSKPEAVRWARQVLATPWLEVIEKALVASESERQDEFVEETLDFIRYVREQAPNFQIFHQETGSP